MMNTISRPKRSRSCGLIPDQARKYSNNWRRDDDMKSEDTTNSKDTETTRSFYLRTNSENTLSSAYLNTLVSIVNMNEFLKHENSEKTFPKEDNDELSMEMLKLRECEESLRADMKEVEELLVKRNTLDDNGSTFTPKEQAISLCTPPSAKCLQTKISVHSSPASVLDYPLPRCWHAGENDVDQEQKDDTGDKLMVPVLGQNSAVSDNLPVRNNTYRRRLSFNQNQDKNAQYYGEVYNCTVSEVSNDVLSSDQVASKSSLATCIENDNGNERYRERNKIQNNTDNFPPFDYCAISKNNCELEENNHIYKIHMFGENIENKLSWIDRFASAIYGWTEYETKPLFPLQLRFLPEEKPKGNKRQQHLGVKHTRSYQGGVSVFIATYILTSSLMEGLSKGAIFCSLIFLVPSLITFLEIKLSHKMDELVIAVVIVGINLLLQIAMPCSWSGNAL